MESEKATKASKARYLSVDIISEILLKLPAKSAVRFRCVCKLWSSITTVPSFITSFAARSSPRLLILSQAHDKLFAFSIPQDSDNKHVHVVDSYEITYPAYDNFLFRPISVHGLICYTKTEIWNPTMRHILTLPKLETSWNNKTNFLGFDPIGGTYKVLSLPSYPSDGDNKPRVLTFNSGGHESWRVIQEITEDLIYPRRPEQCINGVIYYVAYLKLDDYGYAILVMSFHVRSEKMRRIKVPWNVTSDTFLLPYHGKLACVTSLGKDITVWVLEEAEKHEWSYKHFHLPFPLTDPVLRTCLRLGGVNDDGEFIYVPYRLVNPFHILYYDPKRNSYRKVIVEGVADDQFRRRNGLDDNVPLYTAYVYSNHIETLMSL